MEIHNLKEWCVALEETSKVIEQYEHILTAFYNSLKAKPDYQTPFRIECYKKESFIKGVFKNLLVLCLIALLGALIPFALMWFIKHNLKLGIIIAIVAFILLMTIEILLKYSLYKYRVSKLHKIELETKNFMITVPASYRVSDKMKTIAMVYFTKTDVNPNIILDVCDDYISKAGRASMYSSVMFDLPCNCPYLNVSDSTNPNNSNIINTDNNQENEEKRNEFLPTDIDTKVFEGSKDSDKDLNEMIGLNDVKDQIKKFKNRISFYGNASNNGCHMAFLGSAGTGKTTVARIITKMLFDLGYIKKNQYIEISGDYLCAGSTNRASAIIEYSYGGVLFIDEAYLMYKTGSEVIGVLLKAMEDHRKDFVCILAGYEEQMTKLFASNEGFSSRVKHSIYFNDYSEQEMLDIFNYFLKDYNGSSYILDENAINPLLDEFSMEKKSKSFGNARTVRNAVDAIMDYYADRSIREHSNTKVILLEDVNLYIEDRKKILQHELKNASAANQVDEQIIRLSELKSKLKNGSENPDTDLQSLIGLESINREIDLLKSQKDFYDKFEHQNIMLVGPTGCGKSSVAKILTGYLYKLGYIQENKYLDISAEFMKGSYVGHTNKRAEAIISYASGGVLLISNLNAMNNSTDSFASEVLTAIINALHNNNDVTIIIEDTKSDYIISIKDLFTIYYEFPTYSNDQLLQIFVKNANEDNFSINNDIITTIANYIKTSNLDINGVISCYNNIKKKHISNYDGNEDTKFILTQDDLDIPKLNNQLKLNIKNNNKQTLKLNIKKK